MFIQCIATATLRQPMLCQGRMRTCLRQFIRAFMGRRFITGSGIHGTMLRDATTTAVIGEGFIATEMTFTAIAGNAKLDNSWRCENKLEHQERVEHESENVSLVDGNDGICVCVLGAKCYGV
jgi:hypothetical protein